MPELPDVELYLSALEPRILEKTLERVRVRRPFLLRSVEPPLESVHGHRVVSLSRLGKRIVIGLDGELFLVVHLMIAGRFKWFEHVATAEQLANKITLASFDFPAASLVLTEAGTKRRASLYVVKGREALAEHDPGGVDPLSVDRDGFVSALTRENHTLKRVLTDPRAFSGIGNAYSDEILFAAGLSPLKWSTRLGPDEIDRLQAATRRVLSEWTERLKSETGVAFPTKVTAFRPGMAVHGRYRQPCPVCGTLVQRIVHAENEMNYCPRCQTAGKLLADRSLSKLLKDDFPRTIEEWEALRRT